MRRGGDNRGNNAARKARKQYLIEHYRANTDVVRVEYADGTVVNEVPVVGIDEWIDEVVRCSFVVSALRMPACRCYRCGCLLTVETVTVDRRIPGAEGGSYFDRMNLRPACSFDNSSTGGFLGNARKKAS